MTYKVGGQVVIDDSRNITAASFTGNGSGLTNINYFPAGTVMLFVQTAAPVGWTKSTAHNNKALRIVNGAVGSGGTVAFSSAFTNQTISISGGTDFRTVTGTVGDTTLTVAQMPAHQHLIIWNFQSPSGGSGDRASWLGGTGSSSFTNFEGGSLPHTHAFTGGSHQHAFAGSTTMDLSVQYVDAIIATKD